MNEQVKRLMGQALDKKLSHTWITLDQQDLEKFSACFAELLVKEFVDIIDASRVEATDLKLPSSSSMSILKNYVKKYFGANDE